MRCPPEQIETSSNDAEVGDVIGCVMEAGSRDSIVVFIEGVTVTGSDPHQINPLFC